MLGMGVTMQSLAAYSFSCELDHVSATERMVELRSMLDIWLARKGADDLENSKGEFKSRSGDNIGHFSRQSVESSIGEMISLILVETAHTGQIFSTEIFLIKDGSGVSVFMTLGATGGDGVVLPRRIVPRCPQILREILLKYDDWSVGGWSVPAGDEYVASSVKKVEELHSFILDSGRNLPVIVINSEILSEWADCPKIIARELAGLAYVYLLEDSFSEEFAERIGDAYACFSREVKLYWPLLDDGASGLFGRGWRGRSLGRFGEGDAGARRFSESVREMVMSAAAQALILPAVAREIKTRSVIEKIGSLKEDVLENELKTIVDENFDLSNKVEELTNEIAELKRKLSAAIISASGKEEADDLDPVDDFSGPRSGDLIYYKKVDSKGNADVMVRTSRCNHREGAWKSAFSGDKAEKGIAKLEGRNNWKSIQHCNSCTGGGHWRVRW